LFPQEREKREREKEAQILKELREAEKKQKEDELYDAVATEERRIKAPLQLTPAHIISMYLCLTLIPTSSLKSVPKIKGLSRRKRKRKRRCRCC